MTWGLQELGPLVTTGLAAAAAIASAIAAWRAPLTAAKVAEAMRRQGDVLRDGRKMKTTIFSTIMQHRAEIASEECVRALNLIDVAFYDSKTVREAWLELHKAFEAPQYFEPYVNERVGRLLQAMVQELGLSDTLSLQDFNRAYFPKYLVEKREHERMQRDITRIQHLEFIKQSSSQSDSDPNFAEKWPPVPTAR